MDKDSGMAGVPGLSQRGPNSSFFRKPSNMHSLPDSCSEPVFLRRENFGVVLEYVLRTLTKGKDKYLLRGQVISERGEDRLPIFAPERHSRFGKGILERGANSVVPRF
jgi:hypothetical protein